MTAQEIYQQDMNDKKELEYLIIHLTSEPFLLDLSKHMRDKLKGMIEQEIAEIEYYCNGPSEAQLEFEQSLLNDVSQEDIDEEQMKSVLAS